MEKFEIGNLLPDAVIFKIKKLFYSSKLKPKVTCETHLKVKTTIFISEKSAKTPCTDLGIADRLELKKCSSHS